MKPSEHFDKIYTWTSQHLPYPRFSDSTRLIYLAILITLVAVIQLTTSIRMGDTDMWYHIADGRYFWENLEIPTTLYYSFFQEKDTSWFNHFWGFQAIIAPVFELTGYQGLLIFRSFLVTTIVLMVSFFLFDQQRDKFFWLKAVVLFAFITLMLARGYQLRPHLFSYLMIPTFLFILEQRRQYVFLLPVLTVIWLNTHAVEWVIGAIICGAYFFEELLKNKKEWDKNY